MTQTIQVNGREFRVEVQNGSDGPVYHLHGKRKAHYFTMRTEPRPEIMFLCDARGFGVASSMDGVWLTDAGGTLRVR